MLVSRNYLLMILDEEKGKGYSRVSAAKDLGLAGAFLMDLFLQGKISIEKKRVKVIDSSITGNEYLDDIFEIVKSSKKMRKVMDWIEKLARKHKSHSKAFYKRLEEQGILRIEEKKVLEIFSSKRYYLNKPEMKTALLEQIQNAIMNNLSPGADLICLLSLFKVCNLVKVYFGKEFRKQTNSRIDELIQSEILEPKTREMIQIITKSIQDIITLRITVITATAAAT